MERKQKLATHGSTLFLRLAVLSFAALIVGLCLVALPVGIASEKYALYRWILFGLYVPALPFFYAVYQIMKLLHCIDIDIAFSDISLIALKRIKLCGILIAGLFGLGLPYIYYVSNKDDSPGVIVIALVLVGASTAVAVIAAVLQRLLQNAIEIKAENDLTV